MLIHPKTILFNIVMTLLYALSAVVPEKKNLCVFGAWYGRRYADNSRYLYEYLLEHEPNIQAIWMCRDRRLIAEVRDAGGRGVLINSILGWWLSARSHLVVINCFRSDVNRFGLANKLIIQLWHGTPLKQIGRDSIITSRAAHSKAIASFKWLWMRVFPFDDDRWTVMFASSEEAKARLVSAFRMAPENVIIAGDPRSDIILEDNPDLLPIVKQCLVERPGCRFILYAPTFRNRKADNAICTDTLFFPGIAEVLEKHNSVLLYQGHLSASVDNLYHPLRSRDGRIISLQGNQSVDLNRLLPFVDILVTDYSSIYIDFLLLNRPIIFYAFDLPKYLREERPLYEDYHETVPGPVCDNVQGFSTILEKLLAGEDDHESERKAAKHRFQKYHDGCSRKRILEVVKYWAGWK